jgi:3-deoxy-manno-octulosonate cytidylyltransferase (CMP-KDO synthetase)
MRNEADYFFTGIIPARYASSRFPGKPLTMIGNKPMIQRVYEQSLKSLTTVYVATDDKRIFDATIAFGGKAVMTSVKHQSGTDRCAEAIDIIMNETGTRIDVVINIQGDEPFIKPEQIDLLKSCFKDQEVKIATLVRKTSPGEDIDNPNHPKVILDKNSDAIYFSRSVIPYLRDVKRDEWAKKHKFYKHIGLYAFKTDTLRAITAMPKSSLEIAESLEQNRWLENGYKIKCTETGWESISIDTPEDLERIRPLIDNII